MTCHTLLKSLTVLLVEDELTLAHLLRDAIGDRFDRFELASDGEEGLESVRQHLPDLVVTDITMPRMDGLTMSAILQREYPKLPVIILSAYSEKKYLLEAIDVGIRKYLIKPFDPDELLETICTLAQQLEPTRLIPLLPPYTFDPQRHALLWDGVRVPLTQREGRFIHHLLSAPHAFLSFEEIKVLLWGDATISDATIRVFINRLRRKSHTDLIQSVTGQGYALYLPPCTSHP